jgi:hypothetical protein
MSDLKHIRRQAAECREKAQATKDQDQRELWLRLAEEYRKLASEIEERIGRGRG